MDMYAQVRSVVQQNSTSWSGLVAFETAFSDFVQKLEVLNELSYGQENVTIGVRVHKDVVRYSAIEKALEIAAMIKAFASATGSAELKAQMKITLSKIKFGRKNEALMLIDRIIEKANAHSSELVDFGLTQTKLDELHSVRIALGEAISSPRKAIIERKSITLSIDEKFEEMDELLKGQLDHLVYTLKIQAPKLYKDYNAARLVIEPPHGKSPSNGTNEQSAY